jgi:hypothetical protein
MSLRNRETWHLPHIVPKRRDAVTMCKYCHQGKVLYCTWYNDRRQPAYDWVSVQFHSSLAQVLAMAQDCSYYMIVITRPWSFPQETHLLQKIAEVCSNLVLVGE